MADLMESRRRIMSAQTSMYVPQGYQPVAYLESSGTQVIETGFVPTFQANDQMYLRFALLPGTKNPSIIFGCEGQSLGTRNASAQIVYFANSSYYSNKNALRCDLRGLYYAASDFFGELNPSSDFNEFTTSGLVARCLNKNITADSAISGTTKQLYLFGQKVADKNKATCRISSMWYKRDGAFLIRLIPCVADGVAGMYDTVSNQFLTNAGTGTFTPGPAIF